LAALYVVEGALTTERLMHGEWWRLFSSCFLHLGFIHLASNLLMLFIIGPLTERMWGSGRYLLIYLISGFGGACSMAYFDGPNSVGGGASGALWGVMTALITWIVLNRAHMPRPFVNMMLQRLFALVVLNVAFSFSPGVSSAAHFGGGAIGVVASLLMHGSLHGKFLVKLLSNLGAVLLPVACFGSLYQGLRQDPKWDLYNFELHVVPRLLAAETRASEILERQWQPFRDRRPGSLSVQDLSQVIQAQHESVDAYKKGVEAAEQHARYRDARLENHRQEIVSKFQDRIARVELRSWQQMIDPAVSSEARQAKRFFNDRVTPLLAEPAAARDKETTGNTEAALKDWMARLTALRDLLDNMGPQTSDAGLDQLRKEKIESLQLLLDLLELAESGLKQGSSWPVGERNRFEALVKQIN
jgi:rhomboid protease GluP